MRNIAFKVDPNDHYGDGERAVRACGLLMDWMMDAAMRGAPVMADVLVKEYPYFLGWVGPDGATVVDNKFCYPGDPDLQPYLKVENGAETVLVYPHSLVAVLNDGNLTQWARFD